MKPLIIGVAGKKNSGKDTVASMINYITTVGLSRCKYAEWITNRANYDISQQDRIIHFADNLKKVLSIMFNIPLECFYNRTYKDELYYDFESGNFINQEKINKYPKQYFIIEKADENGGIAFYFNLLVPNIVIKLRTLLQIVGTDICKKHINENIWIRSTIKEAINIALGRNICIIPDVRFMSESNAIHNVPPYGVVLLINRNTKEIDSHESEIINVEYDYEIDNNGTLMNLFYNIVSIIQKIYENN